MTDKQQEILKNIAKSITNINNTLTIILNEFITRRTITIDREVLTIERCSQTTDDSITSDRISTSTQTEISV